MLDELRTMAALDKTQLAETYRVPIDAADTYRLTKTVAVLDVVISGLDEAIEEQNRQAHYKGVAKE